MATSRKRAVGRMLVIGGAEDPDEDDMRILPHLVEMAGGKRARIVVCSAPAENPVEKARVYDELFRSIGVAEVVGAPIRARADAEEDELVEAVERASAVFLTGGDQLRLTSHIAGTRFSEAVRDRLQAGRLVVAGTSAGAAALGSTMIIGGPADGTVRRADVSLAPGLGYWRDAVVDTHFNERGRDSRLLTIFAHNPQTLGVGVDENTALELVPGERFTVLGAGVVTVFDGRVSHTNAPEAGDRDPLALVDSVLHVLPGGYGFNLKSMRPALPDGEEIEGIR